MFRCIALVVGVVLGAAACGGDDAPDRDAVFDTACTSRRTGWSRGSALEHAVDAADGDDVIAAEMVAVAWASPDCDQP